MMKQLYAERILMMKMRKHWWIWIPVILYIGFIYSNSLTAASVSSVISETVAAELASFLKHFGLTVGNIELFHYYVRKMAHFTEFSGLGFLVSIAICICPLFKRRSLNFILFLMLVPFSDEMLQRLVPGRTGQFSDMMIDCSGILVGGLLGYFIFLAVKDCYNALQKKSVQ